MPTSGLSEIPHEEHIGPSALFSHELNYQQVYICERERTSHVHPQVSAAGGSVHRNKLLLKKEWLWHARVTPANRLAIVIAQCESSDKAERC